LAAFTIIDAHTVFGFWPFRRADLSLETLVNVLRQHQVTRALTISTTGIFNDYQRGNEETVAVCQQTPELFPTATIDPRRYLGCREEIDRRIGQGLKLFRVFPEYQDWPLEYAPFLRLLQHLAERGAVLMISAAERGVATCLARLTEGLPLKVILTAVRADNLGELLVVLEERPHWCVETRWLNSPGALTTLAAAVGAERLIFGSATPLYYFSSAYLPVLAADLTEEQKALILGENLRRLLS